MDDRDVFFIIIFCVMLALLYSPLKEDFDDHPIWNIIYVIPGFYLMPLTLFAIGIDESSVLLVILGIIQFIIHIVIVIMGYGKLFISKVTMLLLEASSFLLRILSILEFIAIAMKLIGVVPHMDSSLLQVVFRYIF